MGGSGLASKSKGFLTMKFSLPFLIAIGLGLIAYQNGGVNFSGHQNQNNMSKKLFAQTEVLKYSLFIKAKVDSSEDNFEMVVPAEALFLPDSTHLKSEAVTQLSSFLKAISSKTQKNAIFKVDLSAPNQSANLKFRSSRLRRISEVIQKAGLANEKTIELSQTLIESQSGREVASTSGLSASSNQNISIRIQTAN